MAMRHHARMQATHRIRAGGDTPERKYRVHQTSQSGTEHGQTEGQGRAEVLPVGFAYRGRVFGEQFHINPQITFAGRYATRATRRLLCFICQISRFCENIFSY